jgi:hypothetical protein
VRRHQVQVTAVARAAWRCTHHARVRAHAHASARACFQVQKVKVVNTKVKEIQVGAPQPRRTV